MRIEIFKQNVAESVCEYNVGSMQKGEGEIVDRMTGSHALMVDVMSLVESLEPGEALIVVRGSVR